MHSLEHIGKVDEDVVFHKLKYLRIVGVCLERWEAAGSDNFPMLEQLFLGWLDELKEIPESIGDILTLKLIQIDQCTSALENSATKFKKSKRAWEIMSFKFELLQRHFKPIWIGNLSSIKDPSLPNLFLINNIHYMVRSVRRSEAKDLLGDDWVQRHRRVVQQHANQYKRIAWAKILQCLSIQGLTSSGGSNSMGVNGQNSSGVSRALVKERLKTFNIQFEDFHQRQSQWTVPDTELRESLRLAVAEVLLPVYRSFIKRFGPMVESGKNPQKYIRYSAEDLERMLGEFFEGKTLNEPKRWAYD